MPFAWSFALMCALLAAPVTQVPEPMKGPIDPALTYKSNVDGTRQPYRLYLPSAYDG